MLFHMKIFIIVWLWLWRTWEFMKIRIKINEMKWNEWIVWIVWIVWIEWNIWKYEMKWIAITIEMELRFHLWKIFLLSFASEILITSLLFILFDFDFSFSFSILIFTRPNDWAVKSSTKNWKSHMQNWKQNNANVNAHSQAPFISSSDIFIFDWNQSSFKFLNA